MLKNETIWLKQKQMALFFGKEKATINEFIKNIFNEGELEKCHVSYRFGISKFLQKAHYYHNLDIIISVCYLVKAQQGILFRTCATQRFKELGQAIKRLGNEKIISKQNIKNQWQQVGASNG